MSTPPRPPARSPRLRTSTPACYRRRTSGGARPARGPSSQTNSPEREDPRPSVPFPLPWSFTQLRRPRRGRPPSNAGGGAGDNHDALVEVLSMKRGQQPLTPEWRRELVQSIVSQQQEQVANLLECQLENWMLSAVIFVWQHIDGGKRYCWRSVQRDGLGDVGALVGAQPHPRPNIECFLRWPMYRGIIRQRCL